MFSKNRTRRAIDTSRTRQRRSQSTTLPLANRPADGIRKLVSGAGAFGSYWDPVDEPIDAGATYESGTSG